MKLGAIKSFRCSGIIAAIAVIMCVLTLPANCQTKDKEVVLLLEQTPVIGGEITPVAGVHHFKPDSEVVLNANPKPGYRFIHWLGDVSDPKSSKTVVYLNEPKVIIAVFEQADQNASAEGGDFSIGGGGGAGGGLFPTALDLSKPGGFGGGGAKRTKPLQPFYVNKSKRPTPEVPEPATGLLMMLGGLFALKKRRPKRVVEKQ